MTRRMLYAVTLAGLVAGALDIAYACIHYALIYGTPPQRILQSVAAGVLGPDAARAGGWVTAALGLGLHMIMATAMAGAFVLASRAAPALIRWPVISAIVYGLGLYVVMYYVVVPHSAAGDGTPHPPEGQFFIGSLFAHLVLVALPIVLIARRLALPDVPGAASQVQTL